MVYLRRTQEECQTMFLSYFNQACYISTSGEVFEEGSITLKKETLFK